MSISEISSFVAEVLTSDGEAPVKGDLPFLFVAPLGESVPEDGMFEYLTIEHLQDIKGMAADAVVLFHESQSEALRLLCQHQAVFGLDVRSLYGVPGLSYLGWFDDASFGAERQMYGPMVAEMRVQQEVEAIATARDASGTDVERARYTRSNGTVRSADVSVVGDTTEGDDSELE